MGLEGKGARQPKEHAQVPRKTLKDQCKYTVKQIDHTGPCDMLLDYSSFRQHMIMLHLDGVKENWHKGMYKQYAVAIEPPK
jgi:hypothetical protein